MIRTLNKPLKAFSFRLHDYANAFNGVHLSPWTSSKQHKLLCSCKNRCNTITEISARDFSLGFQSTIAVNKRGKIKIQQKHKKKEVARNCLRSSVFLFPKQFCGFSHSTNPIIGLQKTPYLHIVHRVLIWTDPGAHLPCHLQTNTSFKTYPLLVSTR